MLKRMIAASVLLVAATAGVALAASQLSGSSLTQVCVNDVNGLMRATSDCREGEHLATLGGGGGFQVTQNGTLTVPAGDAASKTLPLTGIRVAATCEQVTAGPLLARTELVAADGETLDAFLAQTQSGGGTVGAPSLLLPPGAVGFPGQGAGFGGSTVIATSKGATATITIGASANATAGVCKYLWLAGEAPNVEAPD